ncbi:Lrp/AsnC family transcriptional regulator [Actinoplanes sp. NPDC051851]|uniref:Lrp/AsnC family transcriptional regulator n=1 Tax=Actinoplanes sp. NPDC051851 TaxID=3154753 RepID=UPI0034483B73
MDDRDELLIAALARDGRASFRELAARAGISPSAARERVNRLIASRMVGVHAQAHPSVLGQPIIHLITVTAGEEPVVAPEFDDSAWIARVADSPALLVQMSASDLGAVHASVERIGALPWVRDVQVDVYLRLHAGPGAGVNANTDPGPWVVAPGRALDAVDHQLAELLRVDGRAAYTDLAAQVGLSVAAVRTRVLRLLESGAIRLRTVVRRPAAQALVTLRVGAQERAAALVALTGMPGVDYLAEVAGVHNLHCSVAAPTSEGLASLTAVLAALPGVRSHAVLPVTVLRHRLAWSSGVRERRLPDPFLH